MPAAAPAASARGPGSSRHALRALASAAIALAAACSGGSSASAPPAPTQVRVSGVPGAPDDVDLAWTAPPEAVDGFLVELRIGGGAFVPQNDPGSLIPPEWRGLRVTLAVGAPDLVEYVVRMQAVRGGKRSAWSNEAAWRRPITPPRNLTGRFDWDAMGEALVWERRSTGATAFVVERVPVDADGLSTGPWESLPVTDPAASGYLDRTAATNGRYWYRVANTAGPEVSAWTAAGPFVTGLAPPLPSTISFYGDEQAVALSWITRATDATGTRLERQTVDSAGGALGPWEVVPLPPGTQTSFLDRTWPEVSRLAYRVASLRGDHASEPVPFKSTVTSRMWPPTDLAAVQAGPDIDLGWVNRSQAASTVEVAWTPQFAPSTGMRVVATLPSTTTACRIGGLGLGYYRLRVTAARPQTPSATTALDYVTPNPPGALSLVGGALPASGAVDAAALPGGGWVFLSTSPGLAVESNGDPWPVLQVPDPLAGTVPFLAADASGRPHLVYAAAPVGGGDPSLVHRWFEGGAWSTETLYQGPILANYGLGAFAVALDASGAPHALLGRQLSPGQYGLLYVHEVDGIWTREPLPTPSRSVGAVNPRSFGFDSGGALHLIHYNTTTSNSAYEWMRDAGGVWHASPIPPLAPSTVSFLPRAATWIDPQNAVILVVGSASGVGKEDVGVVEKIGGEWKPIRLLATDDRGFTFGPAYAMARSADGSRVALIHTGEPGVRAYVRDQGTWSSTLLGPATSTSLQWLAFDPDARVRFLLKRGGALGDGFLTLEEP